MRDPARRREADAHEEHPGRGFAELRAVDDVAAMSEQKSGHRVHEADLVRQDRVRTWSGVLTVKDKLRSSCVRGIMRSNNGPCQTGLRQAGAQVSPRDMRAVRVQPHAA